VFIIIREVSLIINRGKLPNEMVIRHADIFDISRNVYHLRYTHTDFLPLTQVMNCLIHYLMLPVTANTKMSFIHLFIVG